MKLTIDGTVIAYGDTGGRGVPLVLVHAFPLDRSMWAGELRSLAAAARVIAPDLRGFGETAPSSRETTIEGFARDIQGLLDALGIERAVVGGASMGGYVALACHRLFPERIRGLVLGDTRAGADGPEARAARDETIALARSGGAAAIAARMLPKLVAEETLRSDPELSRWLRAVIERQSIAGIIGASEAMRDRADATAGLADIAVPTLLIHGDQDRAIDPAEGERLADAIAAARFVRIAGAGHLPNLERPDEFTKALREFLEAVSERDAMTEVAQYGTPTFRP